jgi:hypothetical protein
MVLCGIDRNTIKPRVKGAFTAKPGQGSERLNESLLRNVLYILPVAQVATDQIENLVLITAEQQVKRMSVALLDSTYQLFVGVLGHVALIDPVIVANGRLFCRLPPVYTSWLS